MLGSKRGFTAIEAVIVIAIVAIIGGIVWYTIGNKAGADVNYLPSKGSINITGITPNTIASNGTVSVSGSNFSKYNDLYLYTKTYKSNSYVGYYVFYKGMLSAKSSSIPFKIDSKTTYCPIASKYYRSYKPKCKTKKVEQNISYDAQVVDSKNSNNKSNILNKAVVVNDKIIVEPPSPSPSDIVAGVLPANTTVKVGETANIVVSVSDMNADPVTPEAIMWSNNSSPATFSWVGGTLNKSTVTVKGEKVGTNDISATVGYKGLQKEAKGKVIVIP
ncbi:hypothetical protein COY43_03115 [Candidatus Berkelbacteria bacterium CG_4_10_14_0_8_um_filter_35_9_33_8]|nr:MAG: hypothetical protein COY43_03115 [Candidatus Berkelbacteria bacterium CG_4_10_14_0_8_um_filter_35_9_33_8]